MMGKTHLAVGIASALVIIQPQSSSEMALAIIGGAIGGVASDIDVKLDFKNQYAARFAWDAVGSEIAALLIAFGLLCTDYVTQGEICEYILERGWLAFAGLVISLTFVIIGEWNKKHRGKTHSLFALILSSAGAALIHPYIAVSYAIGFASHIICDLFNKAEVRVFYPFDRKGLCFKLCYADKLMNQIFCAIGLMLIFVYLYVVKMG